MRSNSNRASAVMGGFYRILVGSETPLSLVPMRTLVSFISSEHIGKDLLPFPNPLTFSPVVLGIQPRALSYTSA